MPADRAALIEMAEIEEALARARRHVVMSSRAEHMLDGFGPRSHQPSDDDLALVDAAIASLRALAGEG